LNQKKNEEETELRKGGKESEEKKPGPGPGGLGLLAGWGLDDFHMQG
jgi:hypothetical protein